MNQLKRELNRIEESNDSITVIAKITNLCNLNCPYCYNRAKEIEAKQNKSLQDMSIEVMDKILYSLAKDYRSASIILHGGEPMMLPDKWYEEFAQLVADYQAFYNIKIRVSAQTNYTLIDEKRLQLFKNNNFNIGGSFDGLENEATRGYTKEILAKIQLLHKHFPYKNIGAICLVTAKSANKLIDNFKYFESLSLTPKFNPIFETKYMDRDLIDDLDIDTLVNSYVELFNYYVNRSRTDVVIEQFDNMILSALQKEQVRPLCEQWICNYRWISFLPNGDAYPCGRDWPQEYNFGSIKTHSIKELFRSPKYDNYINQVVTKLEHCSNTEKCQLYEFCYGGCPADYLIHKKQTLSSTLECLFFKRLFIHVYNYLKQYPIRNEKVLDTIKRYKNGRRY